MAQDPSQPSLEKSTTFRGVRGWLDIYDYPKHSIRIKIKHIQSSQRLLTRVSIKKTLKKFLITKSCMIILIAVYFYILKIFI
jgi:hypothetical protein